MRKLVWFLSIVSVLAGCSLNKAPQVSIPNFEMTFNGKAPYEFATEITTDMLRSLSVEGRMDIGYFLTEEQLGSLPQEKQELVTPDANYVPLQIRSSQQVSGEVMNALMEKEPDTEAFYFINGERLSAFDYLVKSYSFDPAAVQQELSSSGGDSIRGQYLQALTAEQLKTLPVGVQRLLGTKE